ncbi:MAG: sigma-70 family RNA polymerase sigma factor [Oscillospiraceae bacterium]|nr:sigma-70 family RNA polymerase sigma factor [Oscillospiraceae bacterium]
MKSVQRFNTELELQLSTYAVPYILGEIKRFIRDDGPIKVSRSLKELGAKIEVVGKEYLDRTGREISLGELAKKLEVTKEEIAMAMDSKRQVESIDQEIYQEEGGESKLSKINVQKDETNLLIDRLCLNKLIKDLEERDRKLILLRYYKEKTQTEVARILGITQVQVSRLEKKILQNMRSKISV